MVVHDREQTEAWVQSRLAREQETPVPHLTTKRSGWLVLVVQSLACVVLVLLALLFRIVGGDGYEQLRQGFITALQRNELMVVLSRLWDGELSDEVSQDDVQQSDFTSSEQPLDQR